MLDRPPAVRPGVDGGPAGSVRGVWTSPTRPRPSSSGPRSASGCEDNLPEGWGTPGFPMTTAERRAFIEAWTEKLHRAGGSAPAGPPSTAARDSPCSSRWCCNEEFARAQAPLRADFFGDTLVGPDAPAVGHRGAEAQVHPADPGRRPSPGARGSPSPTPAATWPRSATRAELDGDEWVINGQKVWTTQAQYADYIFLLARTDPDAPKHAGISYLLVPMRQPGIEVRPIEQVDGSSEFNEVFFADARCPKAERGRRRQQRLEGGHDHPRLRAGLLVHHRAPPLRPRARRRVERGPPPGRRQGPPHPPAAWPGRGRTSRSWRSTATAP